METDEGYEDAVVVTLDSLRIDHSYHVHDGDYGGDLFGFETH